MIKDKNLSILVTGANGFIGKNLCIRLNEQKDFNLIKFIRGDSLDQLEESIINADVIFHLAGENRPKTVDMFKTVNIDLTKSICDILLKKSLKIPIIFSSSSQVKDDNEYGKSKKDAERILINLNKENGNPVYIYRLPGVFGKWCLPNYNSVVATFCNNIANDLPIKIDDKQKEIRLVYIDDVIDSFISKLEITASNLYFEKIEIEYKITLGELAKQIRAFRDSRKSLITEDVGNNLQRALYSTYLSYLKPESFSYDIESHEDERGIFVEMLKTKNSGQFSFFTAHPGITRGGHYHHTKSEKFLVVSGKAKFSFRNIITNETLTIETSGKIPKIVETIPGWSHDIRNIGDNEMIVLLWANEQFNKDLPDTISYEVINEKT